MSFFFFKCYQNVCDQSHYKTGKLITRKLSVAMCVNGPHVRDIFLHPLKQMGLQGKLASEEMNEIPQLLAQWHRNGPDSVAEAFLGRQSRATKVSCPSVYQCRSIRYRAPFILIKATFSIRWHCSGTPWKSRGPDHPLTRIDADVADLARESCDSPTLVI